MLTVGSLFSGIGGLELGLERAGMSTIWQVERDPYARAVLAKHWPGVPCYEDVRGLDAVGVARPDVLCGGFPCQPHSLAGKRGASADERDLWDAFADVIRGTRPRWVLAENVPGLLSSEKGVFFGRVLRDLAALGFDAEWTVFGACDVGAPHYRYRTFLLAYPHGLELREQQGGGGAAGREGKESLPLSSMARKGMLPTPRARDGRQGSRQPTPATARRVAKGTACLPEAMQEIQRAHGGLGGPLNPQFVEWLMGFPIDHTALEPSETPSYRKRRKPSAGSS